TELERRLVGICKSILCIEEVGLHDSLHDLGGTSLEIVQIHSQISQHLDDELSIADLYSLPSVHAIATRIEEKTKQVEIDSKRELIRQPARARASDTAAGIAVIGMAGRFPGASNVRQFWSNLLQGVCSVQDIPDSELNLPPESELWQNPNLVRRSAWVDDADKFDAKFFGVLPREASLMDPQHRLMVECSWHALEDAGYCPDTMNVPVGVFAGCYMDTYVLSSIAQNPEFIGSLANSFHGGDLLAELGNDNNYLATRISYLLNLRGPSLTIQTACSTSLVAVIQACQALRDGQCDMALAGGSTLKFPQRRGYLYTEGGMVSPDGVCRPFDAEARGTVFGEGVGTVLLKRVQDAVADGDDIYAVIQGCGINNDGQSKLGYTSPSVTGQSLAIAAAHRQAGFSAETVQYVEAHGTGTSLGDPIEIESLTQAFRQTTDANQFCGIGSLKSNIGHLDVAAGVTGLIKNCLAIRDGVIPPTLHFDRPNPNIDFERSPFYVVDRTINWNPTDVPRRGGVSSFGVGGTNAHVVLEQGPEDEDSTERTALSDELLVLSARTEQSLDSMAADLANRLREQPELRLKDVAYTLQFGRKELDCRRAYTVRDHGQAEVALTDQHSSTLHSVMQPRRDVPVTFLFPGQGSQHLGMASDLYQHDQRFRALFDECCRQFEPHLEVDLRTLVFSQSDGGADDALQETRYAQPAIFSVSYSLAKRLESLGIRPERMVGHSLGELVAATLAGVFELSDAIAIVALRGCEMQRMPVGGMMAVRLSESELMPLLETSQVEIAAVNGPQLCVVSGRNEAIVGLQRELESREIVCRHLHTSHAFHSRMMEPMLQSFHDAVSAIKLSEPQIPIVSSKTGRELAPSEATSGEYWAQHLRMTVRFADAVDELLTHSNGVLLEVGPGQTLQMLARQSRLCTRNHQVLSLLPRMDADESSSKHFLMTTGRLWQAGVSIDWCGLHDGPRRRVHLPGYRFDRQRHWFGETPATDGSLKRNCTQSTTDASPLPSGTNAEDQGHEPLSSHDRAAAEVGRLVIESSGLELSELDHHASFVDLGFDSLFLVQFTQRLKARLKVRITFRQLVEEIRNLDSLIETVAKEIHDGNCGDLPNARKPSRKQSDDESDSELVPSLCSEIQIGGTLTPLFCVHAADGFTKIYHALADELGDDQPVYGLLSPGVFGLPIPDTVELLAANLVDEIRSVQPAGPYQLAGYCLGGTIALEIAQQLVAAGEKVSFLGMIETYDWEHAPSTNPTLGTRLSYLSQRIEFHLRNFLLLAAPDKRTFMQAKWEVLRSRAKVWRSALVSLFHRSSARSAGSGHQLSELWCQHDDMAQRYHAREYVGRMTLFRPRRDYRCHLGGSFRASSVQVERMNAYPAGTIVNPFVRELATRMCGVMKEGMDAALQDNDSSPTRSGDEPALLDRTLGLNAQLAMM
ncbi:MAG: beta-ketoacyl synthase N-terminal-like domain-containing protein, partial [Rubripirellula sp.]